MAEKRLVLLRKPLPPIPSQRPPQPICSPTDTSVANTRMSPRSRPRPSTWNTSQISASTTPLVLPRKPRGPAPLTSTVPSKPINQNLTLAVVLSRDRHSGLPPPPLFSLNDFQEAAVTAHYQWKSRGGDHAPQKATISRENYEKMTSWFSTHVPRQDKINKQTIAADNAPEKVNRRPKHQILLEMRAMLNEAMNEALSQSDDESSVVESRQLIPVCPTSDAVFKTSTSKYFLGEGRSTSPFDSKFDPIGIAEAAVLNCMLSGGTDLVLKAHFLQSLPDLDSLRFTLLHLNLSFNELRDFPMEILVLTNLKSLKLRNNPIAEIPDAISELRSLETLCISFNVLLSLPAGLYDLSLLTDLDVSYNRLSFLSNDIRKLSLLRSFNAEGNQLAGLPCGMLHLSNIRQLQVANNFMHPLFWAENIVNQPQRLMDLASMCLVQNEVHLVYGSNLPSEIKELMKCASVCDCCGGGGPNLEKDCEASRRFQNQGSVFEICHLFSVHAQFNAGKNS
ncbi:leucine-rich repeat-containing protein 63-like [Oscarella lobularis]|uniref:leucine-rich repeat-containing protein 63-like n=1 Tax=Oscarella lobularis TaxID=121494 RepID=UPI0033144D00